VCPANGTGRPGAERRPPGATAAVGLGWRTLPAGMHDLLSSLLGVPAVILLAAGLGIVVVTLVSRLRAQPGKRPIRWAHLVFGVGLTGAGTLLLQLDVALIGVR